MIFLMGFLLGFGQNEKVAASEEKIPSENLKINTEKEKETKREKKDEEKKDEEKEMLEGLKEDIDNEESTLAEAGKEDKKDVKEVSSEASDKIIEKKKEKSDEKKEKKEKVEKKAQKEKKEEREKSEVKEKKDEKKAIISYNEEEFKILACVIYLEAGDQPFKGKVAVANAILNRVQDKAFPETIKKVVHHRAYGYYQFGLARPGGKLEKALKVYGKRKIAWQKKAEEESVKAAKAALFGEREIPENLCFFVMKNSAPGKRYRKNKPGGVIIADHYFYKW